MRTLAEAEKLLQGSNFSPEGGRAMYYLYHELIPQSYAVEHPDWKLQHYFKGVASVLKNHTAKWFFVISDENSFIEAVTLCLEDPQRLAKLERYLVETREAALQKLTQSDIAALSSEELAARTRFYLEHFKLILKVASTLRAVDRGIVARIRKEFPAGQQDEILRNISINTRSSLAVEEEKALIECAVKGGDPREVYEKFCFTTLGYYDELPKSLDHYEKKLKEIQVGDPHQALKNLETKVAEEARLKNEYVKTLSAELQTIAEIAGTSTYLKDYYKYSINKVEYCAESLFIEISRRTGIALEILKDASAEELVAIAGGSPADVDKIVARRAMSIVICLRGEVNVWVGKDATRIEEQYLLHSHASNVEFKGRVACKGHAKGKAKVILGPKEFHKMQKGDVLVVINTSPDFIPIMHLASAIVSEEGGLTAHVSVVSREFGIPSIVGIRGITEIIKDGDLVEVDAEKGVVRRVSN